MMLTMPSAQAAKSQCTASNFEDDKAAHLHIVSRLKVNLVCLVLFLLLSAWQ